MNRKGNFPDIAEYLHVALILGMSIVIVMIFITNWNNEIQSMDNATVPAAAKVGIDNLNDALPKGLDFLFLFILILFVGFSVAMARLIPSSPKFIIIGVLSTILLPFVAMFIVNIWSGLVQQPTVATAISNFTFMPFIMNKLVFVIVLYCLLVMISLLTKNE